ncbi:hypothetical protein Poli38472_005356 [Pythium oligandrum]|uniref:Uncharacterized protein n=1 Tax=Pythium oligandrum TaxID=41045 RepID=A0A8K1CHT9_PYTOL|nr:hypothetical protein Poli38472_005356 [Pythium oligandrum]|eukprot:TMW62738.1 hypothetical protein Poli38472_005356 [Pythium oligandrum]
MDEMSRVLQTSTSALKSRFLTPPKNEGDMWLIQQTQDDSQCIFLDGKRCSIYEARPTQCRTFPWWPQNIVSDYDWRLAARQCEGINADPTSATESDTLPVNDVVSEAIIYDIHRSGEDYTYLELKEMLRDLQEIEPTFVENYRSELRQKFRRAILHQDDQVTVLDTFFEGAVPSRCFVFNDRLHLVQSEMQLQSDGQSVDPAVLVLDVHKAMSLALTLLTDRNANSGLKVALLGSGGGSMARYLLAQPNAVSKLDSVEPSSKVNQVARQYFGLEEVEQADDRFQLYEEFGEAFVDRQVQSNTQYDLIVIDVEDGSDHGVNAPPTSMLNHDFLQNVVNLLTRDGMAVVNVITDSDEALRSVTTAFASVFKERGLYRSLPHNTVFYLFGEGRANPPEPIQVASTATSEFTSLTQRVVDEPCVLYPLKTRPTQ